MAIDLSGNSVVTGLVSSIVNIDNVRDASEYYPLVNPNVATTFERTNNIWDPSADVIMRRLISGVTYTRTLRYNTIREIIEITAWSIEA